MRLQFKFQSLAKQHSDLSQGIPDLAPASEFGICRSIFVNRKRAMQSSLQMYSTTIDAAYILTETQKPNLWWGQSQNAKEDNWRQSKVVNRRHLGKSGQAGQDSWSFLMGNWPTPILHLLNNLSDGSTCYEAEAVNHGVSNAPQTRQTCVASPSYTVFPTTS